MYLGHAPYASENRVKGGFCLRPRREVGLGWISVAEVKREGFYEAVMADKVSLRPHCRGARGAYSATVPKWLLNSTYSRRRILSYFLPFVREKRLMPRALF